jgi:hypothetical protein
MRDDTVGAHIRFAGHQVRSIHLDHHGDYQTIKLSGQQLRLELSGGQGVGHFHHCRANCRSHGRQIFIFLKGLILNNTMEEINMRMCN